MASRQKEWERLACAYLVEDYKDALTTSLVTSVYAALGKLKAENRRPDLGRVQNCLTAVLRLRPCWRREPRMAVLNSGDSPAQLEFQLPVEQCGRDLLTNTVGALRDEKQASAGAA